MTIPNDGQQDGKENLQSNLPTSSFKAGYCFKRKASVKLSSIIHFLSGPPLFSTAEKLIFLN